MMIVVAGLLTLSVGFVIGYAVGRVWYSRTKPVYGKIAVITANDFNRGESWRVPLKSKQ